MVALPTEVQQKYGERYVGDNWRDSYQNIRKGSIMNRSHKCGVCKKSVTKSCYQNLHNAFCLAIIKDENGREVICGERFCVVSPKGCNQHPFNGGTYGYNKEIQQLAKGFEIDWDKLQEKDPSYCGDDDKNEVSDAVINDWARRPWEIYNQRNAQKVLKSKSHRKRELNKKRRESNALANNGICAPPENKKATGGKETEKPPAAEQECQLKRVKCGDTTLAQPVLSEVRENVENKPKSKRRMKIKPAVVKKLNKKRGQL